jgi:hypothetical protein
MSKREWNTPIREPWNPKIHQILKTIDLHSDFLLKSGDSFHHNQSELLRQYLINLKTWIHSQEQ